MDPTGSTTACIGALAVLRTASRGTGRTTALLDAAQDGDMVVFVDSREARRVTQLAQQGGKGIKALVVPPHPGALASALQGYSGQRRVLLDHSWVEEAMMGEALRLLRDLAVICRDDEARHPRERLEHSRWGV